MDKTEMTKLAAKTAAKSAALGGWKTWLAAAGLALLALADLLNGELEAALAKFSGALGLVGLGQAIGKRDDSLPSPFGAFPRAWDAVRCPQENAGAGGEGPENKEAPHA